MKCVSHVLVGGCVHTKCVSCILVGGCMHMKYD